MGVVCTELLKVLFSLPQVLRNGHIYKFLFTAALFLQCNSLVQEGHSITLCFTKVRKTMHSCSHTVTSKQIPLGILLKKASI